MKIDRKEFIRTTLVLVGAGFGLTRVASCGGGDTPSGATGNAGTGGSANACDANAPRETISANHGHVLTVSQADVVAGARKMYPIMGTATHDHTVTVSPAMFTTLKAGGTATTTSTDNAGHSHGIMIVCG